MDLWSVRFEIQDNFKNIFSEYVEDFPNYISSSLFVNEEKDKKKYSNFYVKKIVSNKFGEFHQNQIWVLEVLFNKKPDTNIIKRKLNHLAGELKTTEYYINDNPNKKKYANRLNVSKVVQKNWLKYNRKSFPIINIDNFFIYGSHNNKNYSVSKIPIKIDASIAFGTGSHETTKCCLKALTFISRFSKSNRILDYGCGTGILGIASKKIFKKSKVTFVDIDKDAVKLTKENLKLNNILLKKVYLTNSYHSNKYTKKNFYDLILANILFGPLKKLAPLFSLIIKPNSILILSGLLIEQIPYMINWYNKYGFKEKKIFYLNGWGSVIMMRTHKERYCTWKKILNY